MVTVLLAHYVAPRDFGLISILVVVVALANVLMDAGIKEAIIRLREPSALDLDTAFYANMIFGVIACIIIITSASYIAGFYEEPPLQTLIEVASLSIIANAMQAVPSAVLARKLEFRRQFKVNVLASLLAAILTLVLAIKGAGAWALVCQMLASAVLAAMIIWKMRIWRPTHRFSMHSFIHLFKFGYKISLSSFLEVVFTNMYVLVIAKVLMGTIVGLYFFAEKIRDVLVTQLVNSIQVVVYPVFSSLQDDPYRLRDGYRKVLVVSTFIVFPSMLLLSALADPLFESFLPQRWWTGGSYLQLLCIAGVFYPIHAMNLNVLKVKGRSDLYLYIEVIKKIIAIVIFAATINFGIYAILAGQIVWSMLTLIPNSFFSATLINYPASAQINDVLPAFLVSVCVAAVTYVCVALFDWPDVFKLLVFGASSLVAYISIAHILKLEGYNVAKDSLGRIFFDYSNDK